MIVSHELQPSSRVRERNLAEALGVSRTPVRVALGILAAEGLVQGEPNRGYVVSEFSIEDTLSTFYVRGALEGLAVSTAAERGVTDEVMEALRQCVEEGSQILLADMFGADVLRRWAQMNERFHRTLITAADLSALNQVYEFISRMPMVAPTTILFTNDERDDAVARMRFAQHDHAQIVDALSKRESARAESLVREHTYMAREDVARLLRAGFVPRMHD